jgi:hypothetical protein
MTAHYHNACNTAHYANGLSGCRHATCNGRLSDDAFAEDMVDNLLTLQIPPTLFNDIAQLIKACDTLYDCLVQSAWQACHLERSPGTQHMKDGTLPANNTAHVCLSAGMPPGTGA